MIAACRDCNGKFGHSFEAQSALMLYAMQTSMATWGLTFKQAPRLWKRALSHRGLEFDLLVEDSEPKFRLSRPIQQRTKAGKLVSIIFGNIKQAELAAKSARRKGNKSAEVERILVETTRPQIPLQYELSPQLLRTGLKMCSALATKLPHFSVDEISDARISLKGPSRRLPSNVDPAFETYSSLDQLRKPLSHVIYVERTPTMTYGVVQFFGVIQLFCRLGVAGQKLSPTGHLGVLDPISGDEEFRETTPLSLPFPTSVSENELQTVAQLWLSKFEKSAKKRGATKPLKLEGRASYVSTK